MYNVYQLSGSNTAPPITRTVVPQLKRRKAGVLSKNIKSVGGKPRGMAWFDNRYLSPCMETGN
jgi:hypothetical protein